MSQKSSLKNGNSIQEPIGITRISIAGYKSISKEQSIDIRPLTILAGANSSGKSSIMQPLLLLKQTLEVPYDPGALLLDGPNVKFTSSDQLLSGIGKDKHTKNVLIGFEVYAVNEKETYEWFRSNLSMTRKLRFRLEGCLLLLVMKDAT